MAPTIRFVFITAFRDRLFASLVGLLVLAFGISAYLGSGAVAESQEMTVVYAAGAARAVLILGLIVFTAFHVERLYDTREIEAVLSRAISRENFVLSYWAGLAAIVFLFTAMIAIVVFFFAPSRVGAIYWAISVVFESLIVVAFGLFCSLTIERAIPSIFAAIGFYALARLMSFFTGIATQGKQGGANQVANPIMEAISYIVPRLDLAGQTRWLTHAVEAKNIVALLAIQTVIYVPLLLTAAMFDLRRKHF